MVRKVASTWLAVRATITTAEGVTTVHDLPAVTRLIGQAIADPAHLTTRDGAMTTGLATRDGADHHHDARNAQRRRMKLWVPHMQRQWLARVVLPTDDPADATSHGDMDPTDIQARLQGYWAGQFQPRRTNERPSFAMARTYIHPADTTAWPTPDPTDIRASFRRARDTAPGADGIMYTGWRHAGCRARVVLARVLARMTITSDTPPTFPTPSQLSFQRRRADGPAQHRTMSSPARKHTPARHQKHRLQDSGGDDQLPHTQRHEGVHGAPAAWLRRDARRATACRLPRGLRADPHDGVHGVCMGRRPDEARRRRG